MMLLLWEKYNKKFSRVGFVSHFLKELALQVYCNLCVEDNTLCRFWSAGVFYRKVFPRVYHCVILYFSVCIVCGCNIFVKVVNESEIIRIYKNLHNTLL